MTIPLWIALGVVIGFIFTVGLTVLALWVGYRDTVDEQRRTSYLLNKRIFERLDKEQKPGEDTNGTIH